MNAATAAFTAVNNPYEDPHNMNSSRMTPDVDDLPPPPPEMIYLPPSSLKKPAPPSPAKKPGNTKRISFDDDVQVIGPAQVSNPGPTNNYGNVNKQLPPLPTTAESLYGSFPENHQVSNPVPPHPVNQHHHNREIYCFTQRQPYNATPKKLFTEDSNCHAAGFEPGSAPPKAFLQDLQRVMTKKWQVAEKCRADGASVHHVYGFRDNSELDPRELQQNSQTSYSRDESVGAWVLQSQHYAKTEPLYAVSAKIASAPPKSIKKVPMPVAPPVVLREPMPPNNHMMNSGSNPPPSHNNYNNHMMSSHELGSNPQNYPPHHMSHMRHCPQPPRNLLNSTNSMQPPINHYMMSSHEPGSNPVNRKRVPPPPKRSETTQLSTA